jgi:hypothetical protein
VIHPKRQVEEDNSSLWNRGGPEKGCFGRKESFEGGRGGGLLLKTSDRGNFLLSPWNNYVEFPDSLE